jgi:hypothetical protein
MPQANDVLMKRDRTAEPGEETIDGVRVAFRTTDNAESAADLSVALPDERVIITQTMYPFPTTQ